MSNEHTAPAITAVCLFAVIVFIRRGERPALWMIAGIAGLLVGGLALYFAPGQEVRYNGLANEHSLLARITTRTLTENAAIVLLLLWYSWRVVAWLALAALAYRLGPRLDPSTRVRNISIIVGLATAGAITLTLLASPKQGPRLYFAPITLSCAALTSWIVPMLAARWARTIAWVLVASALAYTGWRCIATYHEVGPEFAARIAVLEHAAPGTSATVPAYSLPRSRWFVGDDLEVETVRRNVAANFDLSAIVLETQPPATSAPDDP